jgi:hypothetical protein
MQSVHSIEVPFRYHCCSNALYRMHWFKFCCTVLAFGRQPFPSNQADIRLCLFLGLEQKNMRWAVNDVHQNSSLPPPWPSSLVGPPSNNPTNNEPKKRGSSSSNSSSSSSSSRKRTRTPTKQFILPATTTSSTHERKISPKLRASANFIPSNGRPPINTTTTSSTAESFGLAALIASMYQSRACSRSLLLLLSLSLALSCVQWKTIEWYFDEISWYSCSP